MSSRSRHRTPTRRLQSLFRRHRPVIITLFAAAVAVIGALVVFSKIRAG